MAQEAPASSTGTVVAEEDPSTALLGRLEAVAEGAIALESLATAQKTKDAWTAEVKRYAERSTELRSRCHEEIRKSNRDTIVGLSAQCLRSDLLLEASHRRKQRDMMDAAPGADAAVADAAVTGIDAWLGASTTVIDGIDAGVFTTVDMLKQAKKNLHDTYRAPMLRAFTRTRASQAASLVRSVAAAVAASIGGEADHAFLEAFVPCIESAHAQLSLAASSTGDVAQFRAGMTQARTCIGLSEDARKD